MAMYVICKCPKCNAILEAGHDYRAIGVPFSQCESCGTIIKRDHVNEWGLMNTEQKIFHISIHIWTIMVYGVSGLLVIHAFREANIIQTTNDTLLFLGWPFGIIVIAAWRTPLLIKEIKKSNCRLNDIQYRILLQKMGLMKI